MSDQKTCRDCGTFIPVGGDERCDACDAEEVAATERMLEFILSEPDDPRFRHLTDPDWATPEEYDAVLAYSAATQAKCDRLAVEVERLRAECKAWMNGVADAVEPLGYDREAACGPADLLPGLDTWTATHERIKAAICEAWEQRDEIDDPYVQGWLTGLLETLEGHPPYSDLP